jgi:hypothetical protein
MGGCEKIEKQQEQQSSNRNHDEVKPNAQRLKKKSDRIKISEREERLQTTRWILRSSLKVQIGCNAQESFMIFFCRQTTKQIPPGIFLLNLDGEAHWGLTWRPWLGQKV